MASVVKELERTLSQPPNDVQFAEQLRKIREFKEELDAAGVTVPQDSLPDTMTLIGHLAHRRAGEGA